MLLNGDEWLDKNKISQFWFHHQCPSEVLLIKSHWVILEKVSKITIYYLKFCLITGWNKIKIFIYVDFGKKWCKTQYWCQHKDWHANFDFYLIANQHKISSSTHFFSSAVKPWRWARDVCHQFSSLHTDVPLQNHRTIHYNKLIQLIDHHHGRSRRQIIIITHGINLKHDKQQQQHQLFSPSFSVSVPYC